MPLPKGVGQAKSFWMHAEFSPLPSMLNRVDDPLLVGYCAGIVHSLMIPRKYSDFKICPPENATVRQGATVLVKFSDDHPQELNLPEVLLALAAFRNAWPCPKSD